MVTGFLHSSQLLFDPIIVKKEVWLTMIRTQSGVENDLSSIQENCALKWYVN